MPEGGAGREGGPHRSLATAGPTIRVAHQGRSKTSTSASVALDSCTTTCSTCQSSATQTVSAQALRWDTGGRPVSYIGSRSHLLAVRLWRELGRVTARQHRLPVQRHHSTHHVHVRTPLCGQCQRRRLVAVQQACGRQGRRHSDGKLAQQWEVWR